MILKIYWFNGADENTQYMQEQLEAEEQNK